MKLSTIISQNCPIPNKHPWILCKLWRNILYKSTIFYRTEHEDQNHNSKPLTNIVDSQKVFL